tara:strand:- start:1221 stop:2126 length:906 start_codon:yes stop_codon:yes gene_type:complete
MSTNKDLNPQGGIQGSSALYKFNSSPNTRAVVSQKCRILTPAYGGGDLLFQIGVVSSFSIGASARSAEAYRGVGFGDQIAELVPGVTGEHTLSFSRALLYLSNGHQAFGYAGGIDGPVRTLQQHRWPFDVEQQLVFSSIADNEAAGRTDVKGLVDIDFSSQNATGGFVPAAGAAAGAAPPPAEGAAEAGGDEPAATGPGANKHRALITYCEGCWVTSMDFGEMSADGGIIQQSIEATATDVHDLYSTYGEFMATGNNPDAGQNSSLLYTEFNADDATARRTASRGATAAAAEGDLGATPSP